MILSIDHTNLTPAQSNSANPHFPPSEESLRSVSRRIDSVNCSLSVTEATPPFIRPTKLDPNTSVPFIIVIQPQHDFRKWTRARVYVRISDYRFPCDILLESPLGCIGYRFVAHCFTVSQKMVERISRVVFGCVFECRLVSIVRNVSFSLDGFSVFCCVLVGFWFWYVEGIFLVSIHLK